MSDLLPLVVAALRDKSLADAKDELEDLQKRVDATSKVEIVHAIHNGDRGIIVEDGDDDVIVYAAGQFEDGEYSENNSRFWDVPLPFKGTKVCKVSDLKDCYICVGGGFPFTTLNQTTEAYFQYTKDDYATFLICLRPNCTWITICVHGWPRNEWVPLARSDDSDFLEGQLPQLIVPRYPNATVEFKYVCFQHLAIRGALRKLLPPKPNEETERERDSSGSMS